MPSLRRGWGPDSFSVLLLATALVTAAPRVASGCGCVPLRLVVARERCQETTIDGNARP